jgi:hypothetical protein
MITGGEVPAGLILRVGCATIAHMVNLAMKTINHSANRGRVPESGMEFALERLLALGWSRKLELTLLNLE